MIHTMVQVREKQAINHDCYRLRLKFLTQKFEIRIGQSIMINATIKQSKQSQGINASRKYSIISPSTIQDYFDIIFKVYRPTVDFPQGGKMTNYLEKEVHVGSNIHIQGPFSRFQYLGDCKISLSMFSRYFQDGDSYKFRKIFFMAGGTGITPCYQTLREILSIADQKIELQLLFANKTEQDIILKTELEQMAQRVKVNFLVQKPSEKWTGLTGLVTTQLLEKICVLNDPETLYIHCGPVGMTKVIVVHFLKHYPKMKLFKF